MAGAGGCGQRGLNPAPTGPVRGGPVRPPRGSGMVQPGGNRYPGRVNEIRGRVVNLSLKAASAGLALVLASGIASANMVFSNRVGDVDGFGIGATTPNQPFFALDVLDFGSPDLDGTDELIDETEVNHQYTFSGNILSAKLTLFHGGWGAFGPARLLFNGTQVATLMLGEVGNDNITLRETFDLFQLLDLTNNPSLLTGNDLVRIVSVPGTDLGGPFDDGVLDYSLLTITTDAPGTTPVPEPTSWALVGLALASLAASRRRSR